MGNHKEMSFLQHAYATVSLGLLCGWYFLILLLVPMLLFCIYVYRSYSAGTLFAFLMYYAFVPLDHTPNPDFMYSSWWKPLRDYFSFEADVSSMKWEEGQKYMFMEFPHGIFPMGQFLSASMIETLFPGKMICGLGADIIFRFPLMRQLMAWIGTRPASRKNIHKILADGYDVAIIPGGIAEMFLSDSEKECIYFKKRLNICKAAIEEGCNIVPTFFFGNTKQFEVIGSSSSTTWLSKILAKLSRKLRMSIVFFYGRFFLPIPFRHPIKMVTCDIVKVEQCDNPSEEQVKELQSRVMDSITTMYNKSKKRPSWEQRPLEIM